MKRNSDSYTIPRSTLTKFIWTLIAAVALVATLSAPAVAQPPTVGLTQVGSPIWRPVDFQVFTAPAAPFPSAYNATLDRLLPLEGPGVAFTPHAGPYDTELSRNAAAAGLVSKSVFNESDITFSPNAVNISLMMVPSPGVIGSSRDFTSGPVIPNTALPINSNVDMYRNGVLVDRLLGADGALNPRGGDAGFTGASHRSPSIVVWHPWDDALTAPAQGSYEMRWSMIDNAGNGWNMSIPFTVIPEPATSAIALAGLTTVFGIVWLRKSKTRHSR